jgi:spore maturation protein A
MLNYIWFSMLVIGIVVAIGNDVSDEINNPYRNGHALDIRFEEGRSLDPDGNSWEVTATQLPGPYAEFYGIDPEADPIREKIRIRRNERRTTFSFTPSEDAPQRWRTMASLAGDDGVLAGEVKGIVIRGGLPVAGSIEFEPIRFVKLRAVTVAALDFANIAVDIALGLIGIMALWLGLIKVAEEAGLVSLLTRLLRPITIRLFPDVPHDHPAVGAMIMNISANMLGLNNAATPLGLKAMEELNKINPKAGTATNAMCTFLVINTAGMTLLPATAIAIRAAAGSANPGIIIGTSLFGAFCATVAGLIAVKLLQRMKRFRVEEVSND